MTLRSRTLVALGGASLLLAACGSASESGIEKLIEAQTDGDVDINLDDGQIKIETPEGDIEFNTDGDGGISIEVDGEEVFDADINDDGAGSINISDEDGDSTLDIDAGSGSLPDDWPADVPEPDGLSIESGSAFQSGDQSTFAVTGKASGKDWIDSYSTTLESAGLARTSSLENDGVSYFHESEEWIVTIFGIPTDEGPWEIVLGATTAP